MPFDIPDGVAQIMTTREMNRSGQMLAESEANIQSVNNLVRHSGARHLDEKSAIESKGGKMILEDRGTGGTGSNITGTKVT